MDKTILIPPFMGEKAHANYIPSQVPAYKGNPLIECIPKCPPYKEILEYLTNIPSVSENDKFLNKSTKVIRNSR
jgi:hypothetical protein